MVESADGVGLAEGASEGETRLSIRAPLQASHLHSSSALTSVSLPLPTQYLSAVEHVVESQGFGFSFQAAGRDRPAVLEHWLGGGGLAQKFVGGRLGPRLTENWALVDAPCTCPPGKGGRTIRVKYRGLSRAQSFPTSPQEPGPEGVSPETWQPAGSLAHGRVGNLWPSQLQCSPMTRCQPPSHTLVGPGQ